ncbi:MAG: leucine-rich repeat domain-containing protein [Bacilli bacterium]|nr:leucine-rich repeat domain-containing protein [Bacilli bacterium]
MKKKLPILSMSALALMTLAGCSLSKGTLYYTVNIYSDYEGMEEDLEVLGHYNPNKATLIGYCYASANGKANVGAIATYNQSEGKHYDYRHSLRTPERGYEYIFDSFQGNYTGEEHEVIDITNITADCDLFCTYTLEKRSFSVSVKDAFGGLYGEYSDTLLYETKVGEVDALKTLLEDFPVHDETGERDPYYLTYEKAGWDVFVYDDDGKVVDLDGDVLEDQKGKTDFIPYSEGEDFATLVENYAIQGETVFQAAYDEGTKKSYTVNLSYQLRENDGFEPTSKEIFKYTDMDAATFNLPTSQSVVYGGALDETALAIPGYVIVGQGRNGVIEKYGEDTPKAGNVVDRSRVQYDCSITILYKKVDTISVRFHADVSNFDLVPANDDDHSYTLDVKAGDGVVPPDLLNTDALPNHKFVSLWSTEKFVNGVIDYPTYDITEVALTSSGTLDLYPVMLPRTITSTSGLSTLELDVGLHGYLLKEITVAGTDPIDYDDAEVTTMVLPSGFPYIGVRSFGPSETSSRIRSVKLSSMVTYLAHGEFSRANNIESVDLQNTKVTTLNAYTFKNLTKLTSVKLPSSLTKVATDQFSNCVALTDVSIYIDLTAAEVAARDFDPNWNSGFTVNYKA